MLIDGFYKNEDQCIGNQFILSRENVSYSYNKSVS